jgi:hypothetical protein
LVSAFILFFFRYQKTARVVLYGTAFAAMIPTSRFVLRASYQLPGVAGWLAD